MTRAGIEGEPALEDGASMEAVDVEPGVPAALILLPSPAALDALAPAAASPPPPGTDLALPALVAGDEAIAATPLAGLPALRPLRVIGGGLAGRAPGACAQADRCAARAPDILPRWSNGDSQDHQIRCEMANCSLYHQSLANGARHALHRSFEHSTYQQQFLL